MALEKQIVCRQQIDEFGCINVQAVTQIVEDGNIVHETYHRHVLTPGDDTTSEDATVKAVSAAVWTPEVVSAYEAIKAAQ